MEAVNSYAKKIAQKNRLMKYACILAEEEADEILRSIIACFITKTECHLNKAHVMSRW
jgi:hypothetical protein